MCRYPASGEALKQMDVLCSQIMAAVRTPQLLSGVLHTLRWRTPRLG